MKQVLGRLSVRAAASCWPDTKLPRACNPPCGPAGPSLGEARVRSSPEDVQFRRRTREWLTENLTARGVLAAGDDGRSAYELSHHAAWWAGRRRHRDHRAPGGRADRGAG